MWMCVCVYALLLCHLSVWLWLLISQSPNQHGASSYLNTSLSYLIVSEVAETENLCFFHSSPVPSLPIYILFAFIPLNYFRCFFIFSHPKFFLSQIAFLRLPVWGKVWTRALPFTLDDTNSLVMADVPLISLSPVKGTLSEWDLVWFKSIEAPHDIISCRKSKTNRQCICSERLTSFW